jgi:TfoX/Sxy family transcriptional regulator of competence genes
VAKHYLDRLSAEVQLADSKALRGVDLACKHFFSGAALYANGKMCASLTPVGFAIKLPQRTRAALLKQRKARRLRYFVNGPVKKEYVVLGRAIADDPVRLGHWLTKSIAYVASSEGRPAD